ncbi:MAG: ABC transporter permease subunit [Actinomycetota bacterium]
MQELLTFTIIGLSTGAIYAVVASGLVVTYTTSGIFNLAHGATGMLAAFTYWQLRFDWGVPAPLALIITLFVLCPLFGMLTERLVMRGLQGTTEVVRLSVTVALFAFMVGLANWIWPSDASRTAFLKFFDGNIVSLGGVNVSWHKLITFGCAVLVAVFLRLVLFRTRMGVAMRAVVDDRNLVELNGARPDHVAMFAWATSACLAGLAGILLAGEQQLNIEPLVLLVINAYAAAIIGRLRNLPLTFLGAALLGLLDAYYLMLSDETWFPQSVFGFGLSGLRASIPTIVLFIALLTRPQTRLRTGTARFREENRVPEWSTAVLGAVALVVATVGISGMLTRSNTLLLLNAFTFAIAALSLVPLTGYAGQMSLAPLTFTGLGAIAMSKLPGDGNLLTLAAAVAIVAVVGAVVALPALRLSGIYLALSTAAFAVLVTKLVFNQRQTFQTGNIDVPVLDLPLITIDSPRGRLILAACAFSLLGLGVVALRRSRLGRQLIALKDSPAAAATLGMSLTRAKVLAFAISAGIAAIAGALAGDKVSPQQFDFMQSLPLVLLAVVGGVGTVAGALFGGFLLGGNSVLATVVPSVRNWTKVGPGLIGVTLGRNPSGAASQTADNFRSLQGRWSLLAASALGGIGIWALNALEIISHWSFFVAAMFWFLAVTPNLVDLTSGSPRRRITATALLVIGLVVAAGVDWATALDATGQRLIAMIFLIAVFGLGARRTLETAPRLHRDSPDLVGLAEPFSDAEITLAERRLGVTL